MADESKTALARRDIEAKDTLLDGLERNPLVNGEMVSVEASEDGSLNVPHGLGRKPVGCMIVAADIGSFVGAVQGGSRDSATISMSRHWEILERYTVDSDATSFDFSAELNGDDDYEYQVHGYWSSGQGLSAVLRYRVNGASSTSLTGDGNAYMRAVGSDGTSTGLALARSQATEDQTHMIWSTIYAPAGEYRFTYTESSMTTGTTSSATENQTISGKLHESTTKITSLGIESTQTDDIAAGSHFTLSRRPRLAGRKLNLWIF